jgi:ParB family chromosome partitioning protein
LENTKSPEKTTPRLGRGLAALIPPQGISVPLSRPTLPSEVPSAISSLAVGIQQIALSDIQANTWQPRIAFDESALDELAASIKVHGVLQPVMVRPRGGGRYELVAGERRFRASERAGLTSIPAVVHSFTDEESLTVALIENIQREDLNPMEAARGYKQLIEEFGLTQTQLGQQIGKKQSTISNVIRLLKLPSEMQESIADGRLSMEHGKTLLGVEDPAIRQTLWRDFLDLNMNRSDAREHASAAQISTSRPRRNVKDPNWLDLEDRLKRAFGMKVALSSSNGKSGTLMIKFSNSESLESLLEKLHE